MIKKSQDILATLTKQLEFVGLELEKESQENARIQYEFDSIFNLCPDMLCVFQNGYFKRVNPSFTRILGYSEEEFTSQPFTNFIHDEDVKKTEVEADAVIGRYGSTDFVNRYRCKDGSLKWIQWRSVFDKKTKLTFACARDITIDKELNERFECCFSSAPIGMAIVGNDGKWIKVNKKLSEIVGYSEAELLTMNFQKITHPDDLSSDLGEMGRVLLGEIDSYTMDKRYIRKDGSEIKITLYGHAIRGADGRPMYFVSHIVPHDLYGR